MSSCAVAECKTGGRKRKPGVIFHGFPLKRPDLCQLWVKECRRDGPINIESGTICSEHFEESAYIRDLRNELLGLPIRKKLKPDALPTLFHCRDQEQQQQQNVPKHHRSPDPSQPRKSNRKMKVKHSASELRRIRMIERRNRKVVDSLQSISVVPVLTIQPFSQSATILSYSPQQAEEEHIILMKSEPDSQYEAETIETQCQYPDPMCNCENCSASPFQLEEEGPQEAEEELIVVIKEELQNEQETIETPCQYPDPICNCDNCSTSSPFQLEEQKEGQGSPLAELEIQAETEADVENPPQNLDTANKPLELELKFTCSICSKKFAAQYNLDCHLAKTKRSDSGKRKCQILSDTEVQETQVNFKPFRCTACDNRFRSLREFDIHNRNHTLETPWACSKCRKYFTNSSFLKTHLKTHK